MAENKNKVSVIDAKRTMEKFKQLNKSEKYYVVGAIQALLAARGQTSSKPRVTDALHERGGE